MCTVVPLRNLSYVDIRQEKILIIGMLCQYSLVTYSEY